MRYLPEVLLIVGVIACAVAAWLAFGIAAGIAVIGVSCVGVAVILDRDGKR